MKKLKLNVEELHVVQFRVLPDAEATPRGTVQGQQVSFMSCVSCPCASPACGGTDTSAYPSFVNSECHYCLPEPIE